MANLIYFSGKEANVSPASAAHGFTLDELCKVIGCEVVEMVQLADGRTMWLDEEGKLRDLCFVNEKATKLLAEAGGMPGDEVMGNVLICEPGEVQ